MSGSNALAAAKRRRVGAITVEKPPPSAPSRAAPAQIRIAGPPPKPVINALNAPLRKSPVQQNQYRQQAPQQQQQQQQQQQRGQQQAQQQQQQPDPAPAQPQGPVHPLQLLSTHDITIKKMITEFPQALDSLGESFNVLSSNCDNLNERLEKLESETETETKTEQEDENKEDLIKTSLNNLSETCSTNKKEIDEVKISLLTSLQSLAVELNKNFNSIVGRLEKLEGEFASYNSALKNISSVNDVLYGLIQKVSLRCDEFDGKLQIISSTSVEDNVNTQSQETAAVVVPVVESVSSNNTDSNIILITSDIDNVKIQE